MQAVTPIDSASELDANDLSLLLKGAGDALRLEVLRALSADSFGVLELCHIFDVKQSGMSHHLRVLSKAGLVTTRREGNSIFYRRAPLDAQADYTPLKSSLFKLCDQLHFSEQTSQRLAEIYQQRSVASQQFFSLNADKFHQQQELIADLSVYGPAIAEIIDKTSFPTREKALEVGPGTGEFLPVLAERFSNVVALDNSDNMLQQAKAYCQSQDRSNIEFVLADTRYCQKHSEIFDCVVINMVLHHVPSPGHVFADISQALRPGGTLLICDLCRHDQEWTKSSCGDLWLGFDPLDLNQWALENNFTENQTSFIALRNGFQIQLKQFTKQRSSS